MQNAFPARFLPRSLAVRVALVFALLALLLVLALGFTIRGVADNLLENQTRLMLTQLAAGTRDRLDRRMAAFARDVHNRADAESVENPAGSAAQRRRSIALLSKAWPEFSWIAFVRADGKVEQASGGMLEGVDVSARSWFKRALNGNPLTDVHEAKLLQSLLAKPGDAPLRFVDIAYPFGGPDGKPGGLVAIHVSWDFAHTLVRDTLQLHYRVRGLEILIYDAQGKVILGPPDVPPLAAALLARINESNEVVVVDEQGASHVVSFSATRGTRDLTSLGWIVAVRQDGESAHAPLRQLDRDLMRWGPLVVILFALIGAWTARRVVQPLRALTRTADRLRQGDHDTAFPKDEGVREVQQLSNAMREMVGALGAKEQALREANLFLEERVAGRTRALAASEAQMRLVLDNVPTVVCEVDLEGGVRFANQRYYEFYGLREEDIAGKRIRDIAGNEAQAHYLSCIPALREGKSVVYDRLATLRDGRIVHLEVHLVPGRSGSGEVDRVYAMLSDITAHKQVEKLLTQQAVTDNLTGLPNRRLLMDRMAQSLAQARRTQRGIAVLYLDLDGFKQVNDSLGHAAGDELLRQVAARLSAAVRAGDTVARLGGDEFVVLLDPCDTVQDAEVVAGKVINSLPPGFKLTQGSAEVSASVGIALFPVDAMDAEGLLGHADRGLYAAKAGGKGRHARVVG